MPKELTQNIVEEWIALISGSFNVRDIWAELGIYSYEGKQHRRMIMYRLKDKGVVASIGRNGTYRRADTEAHEIHWQAADPSKIVSLKFPFQIEEYSRIIPRVLLS